MNDLNRINRIESIESNRIESNQIELNRIESNRVMRAIRCTTAYSYAGKGSLARFRTEPSERAIL
jgi:hypothetical protein